MDTFFSPDGVVAGHELLACELFDSQAKSDTYFTGRETIQFDKYNRFNQRVTHLIETFTPTVIIYESPYVGVNVLSYKRLVELMTHVKANVFHHHPWIDFIEIDPTSVKRKMGVLEGDKDLMKEALLAYTSEVGIKHLDMSTLNPDQIDSICIGLWYIRSLFVSS